MFPIKAQRKLTITPVVTYGLIAVNVLVFFWETAQGPYLATVFRDWALVPCQTGLTLETLLDATRTMFLHSNWIHLVGNMLVLLVFGPHLEQFMGRLPYLGFYFLGGYAASLAHVITTANQCAIPFLGGNIPTVGASGAIFAVLGGFLLLFPATRIQYMAFFYRLPVGFVNLRAFYILLYMVIVDLIDGLGRLGPETVTTGGVAVWAHVGGFVAGLVMAFFYTALVRPLPPLEFDEA